MKKALYKTDNLLTSSMLDFYNTDAGADDSLTCCWWHVSDVSANELIAACIICRDAAHIIRWSPLSQIVIISKDTFEPAVVLSFVCFGFFVVRLLQHIRRLEYCGEQDIISNSPSWPRLIPFLFFLLSFPQQTIF